MAPEGQEGLNHCRLMIHSPKTETDEDDAVEAMVNGTNYT